MIALARQRQVLSSSKRKSLLMVAVPDCNPLARAVMSFTPRLPALAATAVGALAVALYSLFQAWHFTEPWVHGPTAVVAACSTGERVPLLSPRRLHRTRLLQPQLVPLCTDDRSSSSAFTQLCTTSSCIYRRSLIPAHTHPRAGALKTAPRPGVH